MNIIITGAYGAIGSAIASAMAELPGYRIWMLGRNEHSLEDLKAEIIKKHPLAELHSYVLDLGLSSEIRRFASDWKEPLHVLINAAATAPRKRNETAEGTETQWAVNVLSYYRMSLSLSPFMQHGEDARIVNVASYWAGGLDLHDPEFRKRSYDNDTAYRQSKQVNRMMAAGLSERPPFAGKISINACHPGDVNSKLSNDLGFGGHESPEQGAETPVFLATSPRVKGITGKYFEGKEQRICEFARNHKQIEQLLDLLASSYTHS